MHPKASEQYGQVRNNRIGEQLAVCTSIRGYKNYEEVNLQGKICGKFYDKLKLVRH